MIETVRPPWHFWVVAILALLWNGFGGFDSVMSLTQGASYLRAMGMTEAQIDYFNGFPAWAYGGWILGTWGGVAGAVLLILRRRWATWAFAASLVGMLITVFYTYFVSSNGAEVMSANEVMSAVIALICVFLIWYAWSMTQRGVLR